MPRATVTPKAIRLLVARNNVVERMPMAMLAMLNAIRIAEEHEG
jgi:hypothetical protein